MPKRYITLALVAVLIVGAITFLQSRKSNIDFGALSEEQEIVIPELTSAEKEGRYDRAREITMPAGFLNSEPFALKDHIGEKVILLDIWTYSCINCQRTLPYITAWDDKYRDDGLLVVGVHSPEFEFEKDPENVRKAMEQFGIKYPVVLDNDFGTWHAYRNRYWPRKYLIDIDGYVVYDHIGEGAYDQTEKVIQDLLKERAKRLGIDADIASELVDVTVPDAPTSKKRSPETYFGAWRNHNFGNGDPGVMGEVSLKPPVETIRNIFYLSGDWDIKRQHALSRGSESAIHMRYRGDKVFFVASAPGSGVTIQVLQDGEPVTEARGEDVDENGRVLINEERLYKLIDNGNATEDHVLEIIIEGGELEAYTFTFG